MTKRTSRIKSDMSDMSYIGGMRKSEPPVREILSERKPYA